MSESKTNSLIPSLFLAIAIVVAAWLLGGLLVEFKRAGDEIAVTGSAKRAIESDLIIWRGNVSSNKPTLQDAFAEIKTYSDQVRKFLHDQNVPESEITFQTTNTSTVEEYNDRGYPTGRITGYRLSQQFEVNSTRIDAIEELVRKSDELIQAGVPLWSNPPEYMYTKLADLRVEMLAEATRDAAERARAMVEATDAKLGKLRSARMGVFQVTRRNSTDVSDYGYYDTSTREKDVTAVAKISFSVE